MPISSNARSKADKAALTALLDALPQPVREADINVRYLKDEVVFTLEDGNAALSRDEYQAWADMGYPWDHAGPVLFDAAPPVPEPDVTPEPTPEPEFRPQPKPSAARKGKAKPPAPPAPSKGRARPVEDADPAFDELAAQALDIDEEERRGSIEGNAARLKRGELMLRLSGLSKAAGRPLKAVLRGLNQSAAALAADHGVDYKEITESEASTTRKVVERFGSSGSFRMVNAVNPVTGNPLVADDGRPPQKDLTEVAVNKLYAAAEYVSPDMAEKDLDAILSFLHRHSEKVVKKAKSVAKANDVPFLSMVMDIDKLRVVSKSPITGDEIKVEADEQTALAALKEMAGEPQKEDVATLKMARGWYEGTWKRLKGLFDAACATYAPQLVNETTGSVSNVFVLESTLTQFFDPIEDEGVQRVLGALVSMGHLSEAQANAFVNEFAVDDETGEWSRTVSSIVAEAAGDAHALDDEAAEDEDPFALEDLDDADLPDEEDEPDDDF